MGSYPQILTHCRKIILRKVALSCLIYMIRSTNDSCKNNTELHAKYLKLRKYPYSVRMPENAEQKSSEYGDFLRSDNHDENAIKTSFY